MRGCVVIKDKRGERQLQRRKWLAVSNAARKRRMIRRKMTMKEATMRLQTSWGWGVKT